MKKFLAIVLVVICITSVFSACGNGDSEESQNMSSNEYENMETTEEKTTAEKKVNAVDYLKRDPFKLFEEMKECCRLLGYNFDEDWTIHSNTDESLILYGPNYPRCNQQILLTHGTFNVQLDDNFFVAGNGEDLVVVTGDTTYEQGVFRLVDAILADCPEELRFTGEYLYENYENNVVNGTATFEKEGIQYKVTYVPNTRLWMVTLKVI